MGKKNKTYRFKYDKTVLDLVKGELYEIRPQAKLFNIKDADINNLVFNIKDADINNLDRKNMLFLYLEKQKIEYKYLPPILDIDSGRTVEEYFVEFLYNNKTYVLKIMDDQKYFCHCT